MDYGMPYPVKCQRCNKAFYPGQVAQMICNKCYEEAQESLPKTYTSNSTQIVNKDDLNKTLD